MLSYMENITCYFHSKKNWKEFHLWENKSERTRQNAEVVSESQTTLSITSEEKSLVGIDEISTQGWRDEN